MSKKLVWIIVITTLVVLSVFVLINNHLLKILKHGKSDIDDYKIFENAVVETGNQTEWELAKNYNKKEISAEILKEIEEEQTIAFLVIQDGKIRYEKYWQGFTKDSIVNSFSMSKSIVSLLIGIAIDDGKIESVDQKVADFLPEFGNNLTIKNVLTMSSGLDWSEEFNNPFSEVVKAYYSKDLEKLLYKCEISETPGIKWKYQCGNTLILSFLLEKATGKKINEYASEKLWKKLGAEHNALWSLDKKDGNIKSFCCFFATARDFARLGQLFLNQGYYNDAFVISQNYLSEAVKPADYLVNADKKIENYGYHLWITNYEGYKIPYFRGMWGQYIFIIPDKNAVVVRLGNRKQDNNFQSSSKKSDFYIKAAMEVLY